MRFFSKLNPRQQLLLSTGAWFSFPAYGDYGAVATDDTFLIQECLLAIQKQRGGITEITESQYEDLKKKPVLFKRFGPESITPKLFKQLKNLAENAGRAVVNGVETVEAFRNISQPKIVSDYTPGSRVRRA